MTSSDVPQDAANAGANAEEPLAPEEEVLYEANPAMFRAHPITFTIVLLLCLVGVGLIILLVWWLQCKRTKFTVTRARTRLRRGLLSVQITEVWHRHVRNVQLSQTAWERLFGVGTLSIASAGKASWDIQIGGLPHVHDAKQMIDRCRLAYGPENP